MASISEHNRLVLAGLGSNPVGLDRGQLGDTLVVEFRRVGPKVLLVEPNTKFRALTVFHDHIFQAIRKQHWQMARDLIAQCRRLSGASQKMYDLQLARIAYYEKYPPGENWDGAFRPILE